MWGESPDVNLNMAQQRLVVIDCSGDWIGNIVS